VAADPAVGRVQMTAALVVDRVDCLMMAGTAMRVARAVTARTGCCWRDGWGLAAGGSNLGLTLIM